MPQTHHADPEVVRQVGIVELRAWAIASRNLAEKEGFPGVTESLDRDIKWLTDLYESDCYSVVMVPMFNPKVNGVKNG